MATVVYLSSFRFPDEKSETEHSLIFGGSSYPNSVLYPFGISKIEFEPITVFYGNNGCGKSTLLNVIAEKVEAKRDSIYNKSESSDDYLKRCSISVKKAIPESSRIITSDDVFDYMLEMRHLNEGVNLKRKDIRKEYLEAKYSEFKLDSISDYDELRRVTKARAKTQRQYVKSNLIDNVKEFSNGENAFKYFTEKIREESLYILDEPENSLSPGRQLELKGFIEDSARFFGCQFILSTHSPFLLAMKGAKVYDLDERPAQLKHWSKLENVRIYRDFFKEQFDK